MTKQPGTPLIPNICDARRSASRGHRSPIVDKIAGVGKPVTQAVSATDKAMAPHAASVQMNCDVVEPRPKAHTSPSSDGVIRRIPLSDVAADVGHGVDSRNVEILADSFLLILREARSCRPRSKRRRGQRI
jgi:hypothetical protein